MKGLVDKSRGIVTLIVEPFPNIKPKEPLRLSRQTETELIRLLGNSPVKELVSRLSCKKNRYKVSSLIRPVVLTVHRHEYDGVR